MKLRKLLVIVVRAAALGVVLATPLSGVELVSFEIWLATTAILISLNLAIELVSIASVEPAEIIVAWKWRGRGERPPDRRPWPLREVEGLITSARSNDRAFVNRLRPRLIELTNHFLPIHQAIDPQREPERVRELLGSTAWLIDSDVTGRKPTVAELDAFFEILFTGADPSAAHHAATATQPGNN